MTSQRDRIGSIESRMEELEATIRGLTEELVDANQRIRELEQEREKETEESSQVEEAKSDESKDETDKEESSGLGGDDIIVA